jgi:YHS domain-containing protein
MISKSLSLRTFFFSLLVLTFFISFSAFAHADNTNQQTSSSLTEVDSKYVCMVTNQLFVKEQIPVELEGKTYYGCCEMCKAKIKNNPQSREATDPVSGKKVDKAEAVIGASADGSIYYFESEENLAEFNPSAVN